jgi:hypothetical protein
MSAIHPLRTLALTVNKAIMSSLEEAVAQVRDGSSLYWTFYHPEGRQKELEVVEARLNAAPEIMESFVPPDGWDLDRVQWGDALFIRRHQSLERQAVETMLIELLELANAQGMRLHSWLHGSNI